MRIDLVVGDTGPAVTLRGQVVSNRAEAPAGVTVALSPTEREKINSRIQSILDSQTDPWGIKVVLVELMHIDLPEAMQRAMARQGR